MSQLRLAVARIQLVSMALVLTALSACGPSRSASSGQIDMADHVGLTGPSSQSSQGRLEGPQTTRTQGWTPEQVTLKCNAENCPKAVGLLVFAKPTGDGFMDLRTCTAFLSSPSQVMSSGHCDQTEDFTGYFISRTDIEKPVIRKITTVAHKVFTPGEWAQDTSPEMRAKGDPTSGRPDAAVYDLEQPILDIDFLTLASGGSPSYTQLTAYVVNTVPNGNGLNYTLDRTTCDVRRHEIAFPFDIQENPDVLTIYNCQLVRGNSGAPLFAPDSDEVQAIQQAASASSEELAKEIRATQHREPLEYELHLAPLVTNVRCLDFFAPPKASCVATTETERAARAKSIHNAIYKDLKTRVPPNSERFQVEFEVYPYPLKVASDSRFEELEIFYYPKCRKSNVLTSFDIPMEHIQLQYGPWGETVAVSLGEKLSPMVVTAVQDVYFQLQPSWAAPMGEYLNPKADPRQKYKNSFQIALPLCPSYGS